MFAVFVFALVVALLIPIAFVREPVLKVAATAAAIGLAVAYVPSAHAGGPASARPACHAEAPQAMAAGREGGA